jgi:hypothetical protein
VAQEAPAAEAPAEAVAEAEPAKPQIRFAEEILASEDAGDKKTKAKKALDEEELAKSKKAKRPKRIIVEDEDEEFDYPIS